MYMIKDLEGLGYELAAILEDLEFEQANLTEQQELKSRLDADECEGFDHAQDIASVKRTINAIEVNIKWLNRDLEKVKKEINA
jgi:hypothetical protein